MYSILFADGKSINFKTSLKTALMGIFRIFNVKSFQSYRNLKFNFKFSKLWQKCWLTLEISRNVCECVTNWNEVNMFSLLRAEMLVARENWSGMENLRENLWKFPWDLLKNLLSASRSSSTSPRHLSWIYLIIYSLSTIYTPTHRIHSRYLNLLCRNQIKSWR